MRNLQLKTDALPSESVSKLNYGKLKKYEKSNISNQFIKVFGFPSSKRAEFVNANR